MVTMPASIHAPVADEFNAHYHVGAIAGSLTTGMYLLGVGVGGMFVAPFSETFGRNVVYLATLVLFMLCLMAKALAPNYGSAILFRFITGCFGAAPMTVAGGAITDLWYPVQIPIAFPVLAMTSFAGPLIGPIVGAYIPNIGFRWADIVSLLGTALVTIVVLLFLPETYAPILLPPSHLDVDLPANLTRPFVLAREPIVLVFSFYLTLVFIVLFTFLNGFPFIFQDVHGISEPMTFTVWAALLLGDCLAIPTIPLIYKRIKQAAANADAKGQHLQPEVCLYFAMLGGSVLMPASLFWIGWTCYPDISIWVSIVGVCVFGYSVVMIFTTCYLYIIFTYLQNAGSALSFMTFSRYVVSGALIPASVPMYRNLGPHWSLTWVGILASVMAPVPFLLFRYGPTIRAVSKFAKNKT
ncbi:hypothetical protein PRZ48_012024 [Zasmidium cellare]|uniref:Major facilitator superfamily (MFS) profile domain-containing protein n=1 Tax=Zasmidium cellare TaxID=395010 RepID=A0ABR0E8J1_ZASCE|nr:hypothetical protein PRZ48_012024 [Zasmidium cellare]